VQREKTLVFREKDKNEAASILPSGVHVQRLRRTRQRERTLLVERERIAQVQPLWIGTLVFGEEIFVSSPEWSPLYVVFEVRVWSLIFFSALCLKSAMESVIFFSQSMRALFSVSSFKQLKKYLFLCQLLKMIGIKKMPYFFCRSY
jgi:hypothetical protein